MNNVILAELADEVKVEHPELRGRIGRAVRLYQNGSVAKTGHDLYTVRNLQGDKEYTIRFSTMLEATPGWACDCKDIQNGAPFSTFYGASGKTCKHIIATQFTEILGTEPMTDKETDQRQAAFDATNPDQNNGTEGVEYVF